MVDLAKSIREKEIMEQDESLKVGINDEVALYCMSLSSRLKKVDSRTRALARNSIEKLFWILRWVVPLPQIILQ